MATFPAVIPDANRTLMPGFFGSETYGHASGIEVRFLTSIQRTADQLQLLYDLRDDATAELFRDHYIGQEGGTLPFPLSTEALSGFPESDVLAPAGFQWVYTAPPQIEYAGPNLFRITVQLESVDVGAGVIDGGNLPLVFTFAGGLATASSYAAGLDETTTLSITGGAAVADTVVVWMFTAGGAGGGATGADLQIDLTLATNGGGGGSKGMTGSVTASVSGGGASGA